ncbi:MAG TPA: ABC transporter ATP-binding protein [Vicinamibacterales bacterium]|jgi:ABC-2 type transport system ATP-binding protein|nr:ABC transporter ATP-binding protein [Vicinamibacterales bacterium]
MALIVDDLTRTYGDFTAVDQLSFEVKSGEIVGLIGPNGAGKTTTLRAIAGILKPSSGRIAIDDHDLQAAPLDAKRRLAFMPDEPHLFDYLTVTEHLRLTGRLYGIRDIDQRSGELLRELELTGKEDALPAELSRGMRQKVIIACGLVRNATTLLFDEPLTGLDPIGIRRMRTTIKARANAGAAILLSSHLLHLVEEVCTRVIIMDRGRKIADGTVAELATRADLAIAGSNLEQIFLRVTGNEPVEADR